MAERADFQQAVELLRMIQAMGAALQDNAIALQPTQLADCGKAIASRAGMVMGYLEHLRATGKI